MAIRTGIIGIGSYYSNAFARALRRLPQVELLAAAHLNQPDETLKLNINQTREQFAGTHGVRLSVETNGPVTKRLNEAVALSTGDFVSILYADDYYLPNKLEPACR